MATMTSIDCGLLIRRIRTTQTVPALSALRDELQRRYPDDEATPTLARMIAAKMERLAGRN